jgi:hypothetical protein
VGVLPGDYRQGTSSSGQESWEATGPDDRDALSVADAAQGISEEQDTGRRFEIDCK